MAAMGLGRVAAGVGNTRFWLGAETGSPAPVGRLFPFPPPPAFPDISLFSVEILLWDYTDQLLMLTWL